MNSQEKKALENVINSFRSLRSGLDQIVIGYPELKDALVCSLFRRTLGLKGNTLVFSAPGLAKTTLMKGASAMVANMNGGHVAYGRVQGRPDSTPEEFISRRRANYDDEGKLYFENYLQVVGNFLADKVKGLPGFWHLDELDKMAGRAMFGLLEAMEEQAVTAEGLGTQALNFTLFATANTKKYDSQAQPIPTSVKDRFSTVLELGFLPLDEDKKVVRLVGTGKKNPWPEVKKVEMDDLIILKNIIPTSGLESLVEISDSIFDGCVTATKLTQSAVNGYTNFSGKFKVCAGPRSYIDLVQEAAAYSILAGHETIQPATCIKVGCRVYRGRVEMSPDVTMAGETADTIITKILHEVFGDMEVGGGSGSGNPQ